MTKLNYHVKRIWDYLEENKDSKKCLQEMASELEKKYGLDPHEVIKIVSIVHIINELRESNNGK